MFSGFWEAAYQKAFDGSTLLVPAVHPQVDMSTFPLLGTILSHGYMAWGFIPVRVVFPVIAAVLIGPSVQLPSSMIVDSVLDYLSTYEQATVREALRAIENRPTCPFSPAILNPLIALLSRLNLGVAVFPRH